MTAFWITWTRNCHSSAAKKHEGKACASATSTSCKGPHLRQRFLCSLRQRRCLEERAKTTPVPNAASGAPKSHEDHAGKPEKHEFPRELHVEADTNSPCRHAGIEDMEWQSISKLQSQIVKHQMQIVKGIRLTWVSANRNFKSSDMSLRQLI